MVETLQSVESMQDAGSNEDSLWAYRNKNETKYSADHVVRSLKQSVKDHLNTYSTREFQQSAKWEYSTKLSPYIQLS